MKKRVNTFKRARLIAVRALNDYVYYLQSKKIIVINNLLAGIMRGIGSALGFWIISAMLLALFSAFFNK